MYRAERVLAEQCEVPGFGHPLDAEGDPRVVERARYVGPVPRSVFDVR
jgi:citrate synthase